ncbi:MAG: DUF2336 domain-containing protein [Alphaproteobacteria bacterium]|nr:DUF2336 domain-containing protein [Alphaproteobacteria bacterium]
MNITREDIEALVREPSPAMRQRICEKISGGYNAGVYTENEMRLANEIFRLLLKDTEMKVRLLMADTLKSNMQVPHDIIWALANDRQEIAVPVLQHSHVLSEDDLIAIVQATREHPKLKAVAQRESISRPLSHALVEKRDREITRTLLGNKGAALADTSIDLMLEEFARDHSILEELVLRGGLPYEFAERLFASVSDALKKQMTRKYRMNRHVVEEVTVAARETAMLQFISPWMSQNDINHLVEEMHRNKRLSDSVIIRSLCIGDLRFFETAIARRVGIPASNARLLLIDPGPLGFKALYDSSGLPASFYEAVHVMLRLALEETRYGDYRTNDFGAMMVAKIRSAGYDRSIENMETLLQLVGRAIHEPKLH